ncbi:MAG: hypothetical protein OXC68_03565 [Aestuariivita sp.]|nr:hypothetical protein [Aestuariivita sp.]
MRVAVAEGPIGKGVVWIKVRETGDAANSPASAQTAKTLFASRNFCEGTAFYVHPEHAQDHDDVSRHILPAASNERNVFCERKT